VKARFMSKAPEKRTPYDPAKAARERAAASSERAPTVLTREQRMGRRPLLLPEKSTKAED
jgi:hypothetical protein